MAQIYNPWAQLYNPWAQPPETGTLIGDFAGPQLDPEQAMIDPETGLLDDPESSDGHEVEPMAQALAVIQQQSTLIGQLLTKLKET